MSSLTTTTVSKSVDAISDIVDVVPFDSIADAVSDATDSVADAATIVGVRGGRLAVRTARVAWSNRRAVSISLLLVAAVAAIVVWQRQSTNDTADAD